MPISSKMPTAAKLFAAIMFAGVAYLAAHVYSLNMPGGKPPGVLREVSGIIGMVCGWWIMGPQAAQSRGRLDAMGTGIRTSFTIVLIVVLIFATNDMLRRSVKGRYDSPLDAVLAIFELFLGLIRPVFSPDVLGVLLLGGLVSGAVAQWAARTWK